MSGMREDELEEVVKTPIIVLTKDEMRELLKRVYGYNNVGHLEYDKKFVSFQPDKGRRIKKYHGDIRVDTMYKFKEVGVRVNYMILDDGFELTFEKPSLDVGNVILDNAKITVKRKDWLEALYIASKIILN